MSRLLYPVQEACTQLGIARSTLYELMASGQLIPVKIGTRTLVPASELERFTASLATAKSGGDA